MRKVLSISILILVITLNLEAVNGSIKSDILRQTKLSPCNSCKTFIESFKRGMDKTAKGKFEGGDAAWEEEKLGSYARSEIRLVEIQENICADVEEGRDQCYSIHEEYDADIEDWWLNHQQEQPDLYQYFCIDKMKHCCKEFHYGQQCKPCPGYPNKICNNSGKCGGSGTRKGNGKCECEAGYSGENCDVCAENYFEAYKDDLKILCSKCHSSCDGLCSKAGPIGCNGCAKGWIKDEEKGCLDVNECASPQSVCGPRQFCINNDGSYRCFDCDKSCAGCTGDGPDMCKLCANGYTLKNNMCVDSSQEERQQYIYVTRYLTYLGLCVATCIILQRNVALAAVIGLAVAIYIAVSEYILNTPPIPDTTDFANKLLRKT